MLNFKRINILFIGLLLITILAYIKYGVPFYLFIILLVAYSGLLFYGCYYIGSNFFIPVICSLKTDEKIVAISFDDGPDAVNTPRILQILDNEEVKAAFFCIGNRIINNEALLKQVYNGGHLIGNHSYSHHFWFDMFSSKKMLADMLQMSFTMNNVIQKTPKLFRPPYGVTNPNLKKAIINGKFIPVGWSVRSLDTVIKDEQRLFKKVTGKLKPGAIFLFHDTSNTTVAILSQFIRHVKLSGYQIIRLDKMLNLPDYV